MKKRFSCLGILILYGLFAVSGTLGSEFINVIGLDGCNKDFYPEICNSKATPGYIFFVTGLRIEYSGDKSVSIDPSYFQLKLANKGYSNSGATYYLDQMGLIPMPTLTLYGGSNVQGYIAYEVPANEKDESYEIKYAGWEDVIIRNEYICN